MTRNREVFLRDPATTTIPNEGVTKVLDPRTPEEWDVLRYELSSFVCEGEYRRGLDIILSTYLSHLSRAAQPAVWVSGFYGSGKSHLVRVLEYLWRDVQFADGAKARGLATLPSDIEAHLVELSTAGRREGGLWSAAGTLGAGAGGSVRLAVLGILFRAAGLPTDYPAARFVLWLRQNGVFDTVKSAVERRIAQAPMVTGRPQKTWADELANMYVSPLLTESLLEAVPALAVSPAEARTLLRTQYAPQTADISDDLLLETMDAVLRLQSTTPGRLPCTLLVFDELQQFLGEDPGRTLQVQNMVEACSTRFGSRLLFVGTGQAALQATPQLSKLQGRFTVRVMLSDTDVEQVVRQVVLRKKPSEEWAVRAVLTAASGEIDRHLLGTKVAPSAADAPDLIPDYPLLPVRRRFWERVLRAVDTAGTAGQLRSQLRIVHEALRRVGDAPLGTVVPADFIYEQLEAGMQQSSVLLRDMAQTIKEQATKGSDGPLRSRLCATVFLIGKLPTDGALATGIRANATTLADLLVEDLTAGSADLRRRIPGVLDTLVQDGTLMQVGDDYRLQTRESAEWEADYRARYARIAADDGRIASERATHMRAAVATALKGLTLTQGAAKEPRKLDLHFGVDAPPTATGNVPVWVRDEWSVSEKGVRDDAIAMGTDSPIVFVFLPRREADALKSALAGSVAAGECLDARRGTANTPEGDLARIAMESRSAMETKRLDGLIAASIGGARVFLGGGNEIATGGMAASVREATGAAMARLFPQFSQVADSAAWGTVVRRASEGAGDALAAVGYSGDVEKYPGCQEVRTFIGGAGKKGSEVRKRFTGPPYGWPQDAVDGALLALLAGGFVRAVRQGQAQGAKGLAQSQIGVTDFYSEGVIVSTVHRIGVRKLIADMKLPVKQGEEAAAIPMILQRLLDLAEGAGGEAPLPPPPSILTIRELQSLSGNEQFIAVWERRDELARDFATGSRSRELIGQRLPQWELLQRLVRHAESLPAVAPINDQVEAIRTRRTLLGDPDPLPPLKDAVERALRAALQAARAGLVEARSRELAELENSDEWQTLPDDTWLRILSANGLGVIPDLSIGTDEALVVELDTTSLSDWEDRAVAIPGRLARAREEAAKILAPKAVPVQIRHTTLKTAAETDAYLTDLRATIMGHIDAGRPVIL